MSIQPILSLSVDHSPSPSEYYVLVTLPANSNYELTDHEIIPSGPFADDIMQLQVNVQPNAGGTSELLLALGGTSLDPDNGLINVDLIEGSTTVGGGNISMQEAQEESKPIGSDTI